MIGQMNSLGMIRQSQQSSIDALRSQIATNEQMLSALRSQDSEVPDPPVSAGQTEGQLRARRAELDAQLKQLLTVYTDKNPEVIKVRVQIDSINRELDDLRARTEQDRQARRSARRGNTQVSSLEIRIAADKRDLARKEAELEQTNRQYAELQSRLRATPLLATEAARIDRDYNTLRKRYDDLLGMRDNARFSARVINDFSGETFRMSDPAVLPEVPASPNRRMLYPMAVIIGLLSGLVVAAAVEARALQTIRDSRDVAHFTRLPLLASVPRIVSARERRWAPLLAAARVLGAILLAGAAIPALYFAIRATGLLSIVAGEN